jgi:protein TonB
MTNARFRIMLAHHRGPYKQSLVLAVLILIVLFVAFPPFHFKPYALHAEPPTNVVSVPDFSIPPPPKEIPPPALTISPAKNDDDVTENTPETTFPDGEFPSPPPPPAANGPGFTPFDELPIPEYLAKPLYPPLAREAGMEGTVSLKVRVGLDHRVHEAVVLSSSVTPAMERAAVEAALKCRYKPAKQRDLEVEVWVPIVIMFRLN